MDGLSPNQFQGVHMNAIPSVEDLLTLKILPYDIDFVDGNIVGELERRSLQKNENILRLLRYNNHICHIKNNNAVFQSFRSSNCHIFFKQNIHFGVTFNYMQRTSEKCSPEERISNPGNYL